MAEIVYDIKKKYNELDEWIAGLEPGTYNVEVDCTGVGADQFDGSSAPSAAPFGEKIKSAKKGVFFNLKPINIDPNITNCDNLFQNCTGLTSIDTSAFTQVTNAGGMFSGCTGLTSIDTSAFTQVTNARSMFSHCTGLTSIDCSGFTQVTNASNMFRDCSGLTSIDTSGFTQVTDASYMFDCCTKLKSIDCSAFTNVTNAYGMFYNCYGLTSTDTSAFTNVTNAWGMFNGCSRLTSIDTSAFTNVINAGSMFYSCPGLTSIDTKAFINVTNASGMFYYCASLTSIDTSAFTNVTDASWMFRDCTGLTSIDTSAFTQVTDASYMFNGCTGLTSITGLEAFTQVTDTNYMFYGCTGLTSIDTSAFTQVTDASYMFNGCTGLTEIIWGNLKPLTTNSMFSDASATKTIKVANQETKTWIETNTSNMKLTNATIEVGTCPLPSPIKYSDLSLWLPEYSLTSSVDLSITEIPKEAFTSELNNTLKNINENITSINLKMEVPVDLTSLSNSFIDNTKLKKVDVSNFTTVTDTTSCFKGCTNLAEIIWGSIKPATNTDMFLNTSAAKIIKANDLETYKFIKTNENNMKLSNYSITPPEGTKAPEEMLFEEFDFYKTAYEPGAYSLKFTDDVTLDPSKFVGTADSASPLIEAIKIPEVSFNFKVELPEGLNDLSYTFNKATYINTLELNWKDNKPSSHTDTFKGCTATKKITIGALDNETRFWIETNETAMALTNYEIIGGSDTINYKNLDVVIKDLEPGEYTFNIDTIGAAASNFKGTSSKDSDFNGKLKLAKEGVYLNINLDIPASDISYILYNNKNVKSIKINKFVPATKARTLAEPSITADHAFDGCIFKEVDLNVFKNVTSAKNMLDNNSNLETIYDSSGNCFEKGLDASSSNVKTVYTTENGRAKMIGKFPSSTKFYKKYERLTYAKGNYEGVNPDNNHILGDMIIDGNMVIDGNASISSINAAEMVIDGNASISSIDAADSIGNNLIDYSKNGRTITVIGEQELPKLPEGKRWRLVSEEKLMELEEIL